VPRHAGPGGEAVRHARSGGAARTRVWCGRWRMKMTGAPPPSAAAGGGGRDGPRWAVLLAGRETADAERTG
jgi:hypothetical protein